MSETKHTPGPWMIAKHGSGFLVYSDHERKPTQPAIYYCAEHVGNEANARLIAAAPELLEALRAIVAAEQQRAHRDYLRLYRAAMDAAFAAIRKVEG